VAIAPFAERLSFVTEQLAMYTNDTLGGLLNATFGNVTELIVSIFALRAGLYHIVQVNLLGSVLSNLLLVLGMALFFGGLKHETQTFNRNAASMNSSLLMLASMSVLFPTSLALSGQQLHEDSILLLSRVISMLLFLVYGAFLYFQLATHRHLFEGDEDEDGDDEFVLGFYGALFWLGVITVIIAALSEVMVDAIEGAATSWGVPDIFIGVIVIPIVGNAAEHAAAVIFALKNKMDLALGIAVGSATQVRASSSFRRSRAAAPAGFAQAACCARPDPPRRARSIPVPRSAARLRAPPPPHPCRCDSRALDLALGHPRARAAGLGLRPAARPAVRGVRGGDHVCVVHPRLHHHDAGPDQLAAGPRASDCVRATLGGLPRTRIAAPFAYALREQPPGPLPHAAGTPHWQRV
jgi:calcium/proton exchanger cax